MITDNVEGTKVPTDHCNLCREPLETGDKFTMYASDTDYNPNAPHEQFGIERVYGGCCKRANIPFPCEGVVEALFMAELDKKGRCTNVKLVDKSVSNEGVDWKPPRAVEMVTGLEFDMFMDEPSLQNVRMSPMMIYDMMDGWDVNPKDYINEEGLVELSEDEIKELQRQLQERISDAYEEMEESEVPN